MSLEAYSQGKIKVVWIDADSQYIYSKMFEDEAAAEAFGQQKKDYLIFSLVKQENMEEFTWVLLPYGNYDLYQKLITYYHRHKHHQTLLSLFRNIG